jgi:DNA-binding GntR family transcriptional regulator
VITAAKSARARRRTGRRAARGATARAIEELGGAIRAGRYAPGTRLTEVRLTAALGVSRGSLREALRRLAGDGLIDLAPNRGAVVRRLERHDITDMLVVREVLEALAVRLAAQRAAGALNRDRIASLARRLGAPQRRGANDRDADDVAQFHATMAQMAGNATLERLLAQLRFPALRVGFVRRQSAADRKRSRDDHAAILRAVAEADAELAAALMRAHVQRTRRAVEQLPADAFDVASPRSPARRR